MKKIITIVAAVLLTVNVFAQAPQKMSYQAVIRNNSNTLVTSTAVGMRVSVLQGSSAGTVVFQEIYNPNPQTNANGLLSVEIGSGLAITGTFAGINWAAGPYFIKTETDPSGGTNYTIVANSQLLSVPYALFAANANSYNAGTGISIASNIITNTSPDQTVAITGTGHSTVSGTYPNFSVNTPNYTAGTGISIIGNTITNTSPDQTVVLTGASGTTVTGTYPNYTVTSQRILGGTSGGGTGYTVALAGTGTGNHIITFSTPFSTTPTAVASISNYTLTGNLPFLQVQSVTTTNMVVHTYFNTGSGSGYYMDDNMPFSFIVTGN